MIVADSSYPLLDVFWTMTIFFAWMIWIWLLIAIFMDLFSRHDVSGWGKAGWTFALIVLPLFGVLIYLITESKSMAERRTDAYKAQAKQFAAAYPSSNGNGSTASEIGKAKELLDSGAITTDEYEVMKQKVLAG